MNKPGFIDLTNRSGRNYQRFYLKQNPFPDIAIPSDESLFIVDREAVQTRFIQNISELRQTHRTNIIMIIGGYGSGKSHLLKNFKQNVNEQLRSRDNGAIAIYIKSPEDEFRKFIFAFMNDFGRDLVQGYSKEIIREYINQNSDDFQKLILKTKMSNLSEFDANTDSQNDYGDPLDILSDEEIIQLFSKIKEKMFLNVHSNDVINAFLCLSIPKYSWSAWNWFLGEQLPKEIMKKMNIQNNVKSNEDAYNLFSNFVNIFINIGVKSIIILVDELEKIVVLSRAKRATYQDFLRKLIDGFPNNLGLYFAIAPTQWDALTTEQTPLVRRLAGTWTVLEDFNLKYTRELIETYLYYNRTEEFSSKMIKNGLPTLFPFSEEAVEEIQKITRGQISSIISLCSELTKFLVDNPEFELISLKLVEKYQETHKL